MRAKDAKPTTEDRAAAAYLSRLWEDYKRANIGSDGKRPTQNAIIEATGLSQSAISQYLGGRLKFGYGAVLKFANFFGVPPKEIYPGLDALPDDRAANDDDWSTVRGVRQAAALGDGSFPDEYAETHKLRFRASSLRRKGLRPDSLVVFYGDGESMEPRIQHGDALLFDTGDKHPVDGQIYLFSSPDTGLTVKRLRDYGGRWFVEADNKQTKNWTKPIPQDGRHPFTIEGRLRWIGSWEG